MIAAVIAVTAPLVVSIAAIGMTAVVTMHVLDVWDRRPKTYRHYPTRHVCGDCNARWTDDHACAVQLGGPVRGELIRPSTDLDRYQG